MQTTEINGFLIDEFNQHKLEEGKKQGVCPLCSHDRKPKNTKAKCASYDWDRGLGTCHNCNTSFQLHTYQRKGASEKVYVRPAEVVHKPPAILSETLTQKIFKQIEALEPDIVIIDSIQTLQTQYVESSPGSVSQIKECTSELMKIKIFHNYVTLLYVKQMIYEELLMSFLNLQECQSLLNVPQTLPSY